MQGQFSVPLEALSELDQVLKRVHSDDRVQLHKRWLYDVNDEARADFHFGLILPTVQASQVIDMSAVLFDSDETVALVAGAWRLKVK